MTNFRPLVSIIIPVYNGSDFLEQAIKSALNQTYLNTEIIVVNDGSNDRGKTEEIAKKYCTNDKCKYFFKNNGGTASALNYGIRVSSGSYICWLSHDDMFSPDKIECQIRSLNRFANRGKDINRIILYSKTKLIDEKSKELNVKSFLTYRTGRKTYKKVPSWFKIKHIFYCSLLIPKDFLINNPFLEEFRYSQDIMSYYQMLVSGYQLRRNYGGKCLYRVHKNQGSFTRINELKDDYRHRFNLFTSYYLKTNDLKFLKRYIYSFSKKIRFSPLHKEYFDKCCVFFKSNNLRIPSFSLYLVSVLYVIPYKIKKIIFGR